MKLLPFNLTITTPEGLWYQGQALAVSGKNDFGSFDILAQHTPFVSYLTDKLKVTSADQKVQEFTFAQAFLKVDPDKVAIYIYATIS